MAYTIGVKSLRFVCPNLSQRQAENLAPVLAREMHRYNVTTKRRAAMFIAQVAHESAEFHYSEEIASGAAYEGRRDLGNIHPGDGRRFKGRGFIQITGRANYEAIGIAWHGDKTWFTLRPRRLGWTGNAVRSAAWWWKTHGLNQIADTNDILKATRTINGGYNGLSSRQAYWRKARVVARWLVPKEV